LIARGREKTRELAMRGRERMEIYVYRERGGEGKRERESLRRVASGVLDGNEEGNEAK